MAVLEELTSVELAKREQELLSSLQISLDPNVSQLAPSGLDLREQELIQSLKRDGIDVPQDIPVLPIEEKPEDLLQRDNEFIKIASMPEMAGADPSDVSARFMFLKADTKAKFGKAEPIGFIETFANTRVQEKLLFVGSLYKFDRLADVFEAARNLTLPPDT